MLRLVQPAFPCLCLKSCVCYLGADLKLHIYFSTSPTALFSSSTLLFSAPAAFLALSCAVVKVLTYLSTICPADSVCCGCCEAFCGLFDELLQENRKMKNSIGKHLTAILNLYFICPKQG